MSRKTILLTVAATLFTTVLAGVAVALAVVYGGLYDVASTKQHLQATYSVLEIAMRQSVRLRARDIEAPIVDERASMLAGAACFNEKCVQCHGAPGVAQGDIGKSMQPLPGPLVDARKRWEPRELYWLTKNGIKMSGMPAWEFRLTEQELWSLVSFMQTLPDLDATQYRDVLAEARSKWITSAGSKPSDLPACGRTLHPQARQVVEADIDVERGRRALYQYACNACHTIPGVTGSSPHVGPPLKGIGSRKMVAGVLANTPENMALWLLETRRIKPDTAMPQLDLTAQDAADISAYLTTLK